MSEERTTDKFGYTGERCRVCDTTFKDCTAGIFTSEGKACCGTCMRTGTHKSDEFSKRVIKETKIEITLTEEQITKLDRAVGILQAHGDVDTTRESLVVSGAMSFIEGFLSYFDGGDDPNKSILN